MDKIRVKGKRELEIEVNDKGETIKLDLDDTRLIGKLLNTLKDVEIKQKEFEERAEELTKKEDKILEGFENSPVPVTQNFVDYIKLLDDFCNLCRGYIDDIFGQGSSMKIFGDRNNPDMFEDFIIQLEPYLTNNGMTVKKMKKDLVEKYKEEVENSEVI